MLVLLPLLTPTGSAQSFPPESVLPHADDLGTAYPGQPEAKEIISRTYPRYRRAFGGRIAEAQTAAGRLAANWPLDPGLAATVQEMAAGGQGSRVLGLGKLAQLCADLEAHLAEGSA